MRILVTAPCAGDYAKIFESFFPENIKKELEKLGEVSYNTTGGFLKKEDMMRLICGKDVIFTGWDTPAIDEDILSCADSLRIIAHTGGTTALVHPSAYDRGITVLSGNTLYAESVAESVIAYALSALRKIPDYLSVTKSGGWNDSIDVWEGLLDQKVGIVGYGMTSRYLVNLLMPFRAEIYVNSSHLSDEELKAGNMKRASLEEIFSQCKIITLQSAMNEKNRHMIDRRLLSKLKPEQILINTARGGLIDEEAMTEFLVQGRFRAFLDVFEHEPIAENHPLRSMPNVYVMPHRAGPTYDRRKFVTAALINDVKNAAEGKVLRTEINKKYAAFMTKE